VFGIIDEFIQTQVFRRDNGNIFIHENCVKDHVSFAKGENKKPRRSEVFSAWFAVVAASTLYYVNAKVYAIAANAQFKARF
jgi:hypothetical protein